MPGSALRLCRLHGKRRISKNIGDSMSDMDRLFGRGAGGRGCSADRGKGHAPVCRGDISAFYFLHICICGYLILFLPLSGDKVECEKDDVRFCDVCDRDSSGSICESNSHERNYENIALMAEKDQRGKGGLPLSFCLMLCACGKQVRDFRFIVGAEARQGSAETPEADLREVPRDNPVCRNDK